MKNRFKHNLALKILSVLIAVILWSYIQIVENPETEHTFRNVQVDLTNITALENRGLSIVGNGEYTVDVTLKCQRWSLNQLKSDGFMVYCDLSDVYDAGEIDVPVKIVVNNDKISVVKREPSSLKLNIEKIITAEKPVSVILNGKVKEGFYTNNDLVELSSNSVTVSGPESVVETITTAVVNIDLNGKDGFFENSYSVIPVDKDNNAVTSENLTLLNEKIDAACKVYPKKVVNLKVNGIPDDVIFEITPPAIEIAAEEDILESYEEIIIKNFSLDSKAVDYKQNVNISLEDDIIVVTKQIPQVVVKAIKEAE